MGRSTVILKDPFEVSLDKPLGRWSHRDVAKGLKNDSVQSICHDNSTSPDVHVIYMLRQGCEPHISKT